MRRRIPDVNWEFEVEKCEWEDSRWRKVVDFILFTALIILLAASFAVGQNKPAKKPPGIVQSATYPIRHPIKSSKGVKKGVTHAAQWIWNR